MKLKWRNTLYGIQLLGAVAFAGACERLVDPPLPGTAVAFVPPPVYAKWYALTTTCSGIQRPFESISWYVVPGVTQFKLSKETVSAYWTQGSNSIVIADSSVLDGSVVRHEMLHSLVRTSGHPRSAFLEHCLGVVSCTPSCVEDAGPPSNLGAAGPAVPPDSIDTQIEFSPNPPSADIDGGVFTMVVSARNKADHPVLVSLLAPNGSTTDAYSYDIRPAFSPGGRILGSVSLSDPAVTRFAAGETKRQYFDFVIGRVIRNRTVTNGVYRITAAYGGHAATIPQYTIGPP